MLKLRFYKKTGVCKGNTDHEEFFQNLEELKSRYKEVFVYDDFSLNPTAWEETKNGWKRITGF